MNIVGCPVLQQYVVVTYDRSCVLPYRREGTLMVSQVITDTTIIMGSGDPENKDSCPRCGGKVFEAEKMTGK